MRVLTITTYFPNAADRQRAVFVQNLVRAMRLRCQVQMIAPVAYVPALARKPEWRAQRAIPACDSVDGMAVEHPRFLVVPKLGCVSGFSYFLSILRLLRRGARAGGDAVVHAHCAYPDGVGVALAASLLGLPFVVTAHGSDINVYAERRLLRWQIRWALRRAAGVIAVSAALEAKIACLLGAGATGLARIPCAAFDPRLFFPRPRGPARAALDLPAPARVVVCVGQLVPVKGLGFVVEAWAELARRGRLGPHDRLVLLGDGPCRAALERQAAAGPAGGVHFAGAVCQADVARWIAAADLLCLPSLNEGTPNVVVEALASGVPVVASGVGGVPELVRDGVNGLLVAPADSAALADALERGLARDWDAAAVAASVAALTWQAIAERNCVFLQTILDQHDARH
ncbi:teichuronic acid biosynthesis glycosyltransferase TuaC [Janthinobacterium sp. CG_23.3]|uniref:glycosyltransferase n=1 Tax=unclassified Janthinobacterium TaxID=2610881 RepID=UPI00034C9C52|nr:MULTISPECIES: glycosyltransferase [unclassified Janthinobacterium]MEC5161193.1 teichuronic acid biosynthesis glycosyltransferase TuaC [Janthinobacterium sp. CG_S6]